MSEQKPDNLYAKPLGSVPDFRFDASVARVFPDMIKRSVPGYTTIIPMIEIIASTYYQPGTLAYDLGCSLGASTIAIRHGVAQYPDAKIIAVDNSQAMIERCRHYIELDNAAPEVELVCADICDIPYQTASIVTLNFTLQFIAPHRRSELIESIANSLEPGGVLVLSEKILANTEFAQNTQAALHEAFKRANGYTDLEISQKRTAIEKILQPETLATHQQRLLSAGFDQVVVWYQCFNFASLIAIKS